MFYNKNKLNVCVGGGGGEFRIQKLFEVLCSVCILNGERGFEGGLNGVGVIVGEDSSLCGIPKEKLPKLLLLNIVLVVLIEGA